MQVHFVAVKVSIVWRAHAFIEAQGPAVKNARTVRHDTHFVQTGLSIKQHHVAIVKVPFDNITALKMLCKCPG